MAQVFYYAGTDRIQEVICRSRKDTKATFLEMRVVVEASNDPRRAAVRVDEKEGRFQAGEDVALVG